MSKLLPLMNPNHDIAVLVGLGNPGKEYALTRHNIGFMAIAHLAKIWSAHLKHEPKFQGNYAKVRQLHLLQPTTYMNNSGVAVRQLLNWYRLQPCQVLVIYDDLDLPLGKVRLRPSGSAGGHNGMKSIIAHLGTETFPRLRLGIGRNPADAVTNYVLGGFTPHEQQLLPQIMDITLELLHCALASGIEKAMSLYNNRTVQPI